MRLPERPTHQQHSCGSFELHHVYTGFLDGSPGHDGSVSLYDERAIFAHRLRCLFSMFLPVAVEKRSHRHAFLEAHAARVDGLDLSSDGRQCQGHFRMAMDHRAHFFSGAVRTTIEENFVDGVASARYEVSL